MSVPGFDQLPYHRPDPSTLEQAHLGFLSRWGEARTDQQKQELLRDWDRDQRAYQTVRSLATIHFQQDTRPAQNRADKEFFDQLDPDVEGQRVEFLRSALEAQNRPALQSAFGAHALALWELQLGSFAPAIADHKRKISALLNEYAALLAGLKMEVRGTRYSLSTVRSLFGHADRAVRLEAHQARDRALGGIAGQLDDLFSQLTRLRHDMARQLGEPRFTELGYRQMLRSDYGPDEVARFREEVERVMVPLAQKILERRARALGLSDFALHDEDVADPRGEPRPRGDQAELLRRAQTLFDTVGEDFGRFFAMMQQRGLLDLSSREGKTGGGFCDFLGDHGVPFVFANFHGGQDDVRVFTHECGHAFQAWSARQQPLSDYYWPTYEAAEIHSMSLELLTHPWMELFFEDDADRFRRGHLEGAILFIPYGVTVDAFQHQVYDAPDASADDRAGWWRSLEARFQPWRVYRDMPYFEGGRYWQRQRHIYHQPFYYIDYCLAQTCALQFWHQARTDRDDAMARYRALCARGGSAPFTELVRGAGLRDPFAPGVLAEVMDSVASALEL